MSQRICLRRKKIVPSRQEPSGHSFGAVVMIQVEEFADCIGSDCPLFLEDFPGQWPDGPRRPHCLDFVMAEAEAVRALTEKGLDQRSTAGPGSISDPPTRCPRCKTHNGRKDLFGFCAWCWKYREDECRKLIETGEES